MTRPILQFFAYDHLPRYLRDVSVPFCNLANRLDTQIVKTGELDILIEWLHTLPDNEERSAALFKLRNVAAHLAYVNEIPHDERAAAIGGTLRFLLEAKDCAVRAVLFK